jgi:hypothetical protein
MTDKAISPLRQRLIEDMAIRRLSPKTQYQYIRHVKRFADFRGRSVDKAITEDVHRYQLWLASIRTTVPTVNVSATALRFFFKVTLKRRDLADAVVSVREPRRLAGVRKPLTIPDLPASSRNGDIRPKPSLLHDEPVVMGVSLRALVGADPRRILGATAKLPNLHHIFGPHDRCARSLSLTPLARHERRCLLLESYSRAILASNPSGIWRMPAGVGSSPRRLAGKGAGRRAPGPAPPGCLSMAVRRSAQNRGATSNGEARPWQLLRA